MAEPVGTVSQVRVALGLLAVLAGCGGGLPPAAEPASPSAGAGPGQRTRADDPPGIDPIAALAPGQPGEQVSWLVPGRAQLELDGTAGTVIEAPGGDRPLEVGVIERHGGLVRAAVRLPHARFAVWTDRAHLFSVLKADHRTGPARPTAAAGGSGEIHALLRAGAQVRRLARKDGRVRIRFAGAVEIEAAVPEALLGDAGPPRAPGGRIASGHRTMLVVPGAVIRAEPRWTAEALALIAGSHVVGVVRELDPAWVEVVYADGDVSVRGYLSRRDPPGRLHRLREPEVPPVTVAPNGKVAGGTCLYARAGGEAIGYIVGDSEALLRDLGGGWWSLAIDTPWGALAFAARGPVPGELVACAPPVSAP
jgi:hypothetical protein